jgi:hypothetical protein
LGAGLFCARWVWGVIPLSSRAVDIRAVVSRAVVSRG